MKTIGAILKLREAIRRQHKALATERTHCRERGSNPRGIQPSLRTDATLNRLSRR